MMNIVHVNFDLTKAKIDIFTGRLIMVAGNINNLSAVACFSENFLDYIIMFLSPEKTFFELPSIYVITNKIERFALCML